MKFEEIDGKQYVVIEKNDEIRFTTPEKKGVAYVSVKNENNSLDISGNPSVVGKISGKGILEKVEVIPTTPADEIIKKCDEWIKMFQKVHDLFKVLTLTEKYREQNMFLKLDFSEYFSFNNKNIKGKTINLDMKKNGNIVLEGMNISIDDDNDAVYKYLFANALWYYISQNYAEKVIDEDDFNWSLYTREKAGTRVSMGANLGTFSDKSDYSEIIFSLIACNNLGAPANQIISNLKDRILNQQMAENIDNSLTYSSKQLDHLLKLEKTKTL